MILTQAHFPKSSFYHFFGDKAGLLERVVESAIEALTMSVTPPNLELLDAPTFWPKMRELAEQLLEAARSEPLALIAGRLFHCTDTPHSSAMETFRLSATAWLERALERGRELEQIDSETPIDLQRQILVAVVMEIDRWVLAHSSDANPATVTFLVVERLLAPASGRRS